MSLALSINAYAQDDKTVTLVASGQGKTQDEGRKAFDNYNKQLQKIRRQKTSKKEI